MFELDATVAAAIFLSSFFLDLIAARYTSDVVSLRAGRAASLSLLWHMLSAIVVIEYAHNAFYIVFVCLGGALGTYFTIWSTRRARRAGEPPAAPASPRSRRRSASPLSCQQAACRKARRRATASLAGPAVGRSRDVARRRPVGPVPSYRPVGAKTASSRDRERVEISGLAARVRRRARYTAQSARSEASDPPGIWRRADLPLVQGGRRHLVKRPARGRRRDGRQARRGRIGRHRTTACAGKRFRSGARGPAATGRSRISRGPGKQHSA
jgi:hypothetical protein